jgi:hypothetical protein
VPEVIDVVLFEPGRQIPAGGRLDSRAIDVKGAQHLTVNVRLRDPSDRVRCEISFGREGSAPFVTVHPPDAFAPYPQLMRMVPVHGPRAGVFLINDGTQPAVVEAAWVYGVREAP